MQNKPSIEFPCWQNGECIFATIYAIVIPILGMAIASVLRGEKVVWIVVFTFSALLMIFTIGFRKLIFLSLGRVTINEEGVGFRIFFKCMKIIKWTECKKIYFESANTGFESNNSCFICFADDYFKRDIRKGMVGFPMPSDGVIIATYNEYIWSEIKKYAPKRLQKEIAAKRMSIE